MLMGELAQVPNQTQSQSQPPSSSSPTNHPLPALDSTTVPPPTPVTDPPLDSDSCFNISKKPSNPSKIPIRPQKIRKLSSTSDSLVTSSQRAEISDEKTRTDSSAISASAAGALITVTSTSGSVSNAKNRRRSASTSNRVLPQIIRSLSAEGEIEAALLHLRNVDPLLAALIDSYPSPAFEANRSPFLSLTKSILYQQLANKAGATIYNRFVTLCGGESEVRPDTVLALTAEQLKQVGVSGRKASYLYDLAHKYISGILSDDKVVKMDDRSLFTMLSMVKGIGSWSVHMFMIFSLHRPDVLPLSDLGVRKGVQFLYRLEELPRPSQMEQLCEKWKPYRSVGAWYMWRLVEGKGAGQNGDVSGPLGFAGVQPLQQIAPQQDLRQQQHQLQLLEPVNVLGNIGACVWGQ